MNITTEEKKKFYKEYGGSDTNTGSVEANIAILSHRINHVSQHLRGNKKDHSNTRSLQIMVGKRKGLLKYLANKDIEGYRVLIEKLELRK